MRAKTLWRKPLHKHYTKVSCSGHHDVHSTQNFEATAEGLLSYLALSYKKKSPLKKASYFGTMMIDCLGSGDLDVVHVRRSCNMLKNGLRYVLKRYHTWFIIHTLKTYRNGTCTALPVTYFVTNNKWAPYCGGIGGIPLKLNLQWYAGACAVLHSQTTHAFLYTATAFLGIETKDTRSEPL